MILNFLVTRKMSLDRVNEVMVQVDPSSPKYQFSSFHDDWTFKKYTKRQKQANPMTVEDLVKSNNKKLARVQHLAEHGFPKK
jgi:hypothetical protein